jgi:uncharacterized lipoprotein YajG
MNRRLLVVLPALLLLAGCTAAPPAASAQCDAAMKATAEVPLDQSNAVKFEATLTECSNFAEWKTMLQKYPAITARPATTRSPWSV